MVAKRGSLDGDRIERREEDDVRVLVMDEPDIPSALRLAEESGLEGELDLAQASYFLSTLRLWAGDSRDLPRWRKHLFIATSRITADAVEYFALPRERTVVIGSGVEI